MSKHRDWWDSAFREAITIAYVGLATMAAGIGVEIYQGVEPGSLIGLVFAWCVMLCVVPALKWQRLLFRLDLQDRAKRAGQATNAQRGLQSQRSLSEHGGQMASVDEFCDATRWPRQARWLWDRFTAEPELRRQVEAAFNESEADPNNRVQWHRLVAQLWGRMADADVSLVEDLPMVAMHELVPWIAGGAMMSLGTAHTPRVGGQ